MVDKDDTQVLRVAHCYTNAIFGVTYSILLWEIVQVMSAFRCGVGSSV